jgi:NitT/TauT family transport system substrate-binding protein
MRRNAAAPNSRGPRRLTRRTLLQGGLALLAARRIFRPAAFDASRIYAAAPTRQATVRFNWTIKGEFTPFFVARERGYYEAAGVNLQLLEGKSGSQAVEVVGAGRDTFGYVPSVQVIEAISTGIPLKAVAALGRYTGMCWASWPNIPLAKPRDLEGHRVSISPSSTFFQVWPAFSRVFGIDTSKVDVIHVDPSARVGLFLSKRIDIMADIFLANDYVILQVRTPEPLNLLKISDLNFDPLGYLLAVNTRVMAHDPDLVKRVTQATLKGFQDTIDHPDEAIALMTRLYGDRLGDKVIAGQVRNLIPMINRQPALGKASAAAWARSLTILYTSGVIHKRLALSDYYTDAFVPG